MVPLQLSSIAKTIRQHPWRSYLPMPGGNLRKRLAAFQCTCPGQHNPHALHTTPLQHRPLNRNRQGAGTASPSTRQQTKPTCQVQRSNPLAPDLLHSGGLVCGCPCLRPEHPIHRGLVVPVVGVRPRQSTFAVAVGVLSLPDKEPMDVSGVHAMQQRDREAAMTACSWEVAAAALSPVVAEVLQCNGQSMNGVASRAACQMQVQRHLPEQPRLPHVLGQDHSAYAAHRTRRDTTDALQIADGTRPSPPSHAVQVLPT